MTLSWSDSKNKLSNVIVCIYMHTSAYSIQKSKLFSPLDNRRGLQEFCFQIHHISILAD